MEIFTLLAYVYSGLMSGLDSASYMTVSLAWTYVGQLGTGRRKVRQSHRVSSRMIISHWGQ